MLIGKEWNLNVKFVIAFLVGLSVLSPLAAKAATATIEYEFNDPAQEYTTYAYVSDKPNISFEQTGLHWVADKLHTKTIVMENIPRGVAQYFRLVGYHNVTGLPTGWSNEVSLTAPHTSMPDDNPMPAIPTISLPGFKLDTVTFKAK